MEPFTPALMPIGIVLPVGEQGVVTVDQRVVRPLDPPHLDDLIRTRSSAMWSGPNELKWPKSSMAKAAYAGDAGERTRPPAPPEPSRTAPGTAHRAGRSLDQVGHAPGLAPARGGYPRSLDPPGPSFRRQRIGSSALGSKELNPDLPGASPGGPSATGNQTLCRGRVGDGRPIGVHASHSSSPDGPRSSIESLANKSQLLGDAPRATTAMPFTFQEELATGAFSAAPARALRRRQERPSAIGDRVATEPASPRSRSAGSTGPSTPASTS